MARQKGETQILRRLSKRHGVPLEMLQGKCIGDIEKTLGLEYDAAKEERLRKEKRMKIKGSLYVQVLPWLTHEDKRTLDEKVTELIKKYVKD